MKFLLLPLILFPLYLCAQYNPEAAGAGGASATFADVYSILNNPGSLGDVEADGIATGFNQFAGVEGWNTYFLTASKRVLGGSLAVSIDRFGDDVFNLTHLSLGFGHKLGIASLGGAIRLQQLSIEGFGTRASWIFDVGGLVHLGNQVEVASGVRNLTQSRITPSEYLPSTMYLGLRYSVSPSFTIVSEVTHDLHQSLICKVGLLYSIRIFHFHMGFISMPSTATFGAGVDLRHFRLDVAVQTGSPLGLQQQVGISYTW